MNLSKRIVDKAKIHGEFVLRSGKKTDTYFDKYQFESDPVLLRDIVSEMKALIPEGTELLAGLEMGGIPVVTMLSQVSGIHCTFVRKKAKEYGTRRFYEGPSLNNKKILLVEDVVSSGGAIIDATKMLRDEGVEVTTALCVIDRQTGAFENLKEIGVELISLFKQSDLE